MMMMMMMDPGAYRSSLFMMCSSDARSMRSEAIPSFISHSDRSVVCKHGEGKTANNLPGKSPLAKSVLL